MVASVLPSQASAESVAGRQLRAKIAEHYALTLEASGHASLGGYCGTLASYQLYYMGINKYLTVADGNNQYDTYKDMTYTSGGYRVRTYPAPDYTLEDALNAITRGGSVDARNILVGFQSTNTAAGQLYGHAVVIYGIIDGMVYFTESYGTSFAEVEGLPAACTISQFVASYTGWTVFEGAVWFGEKGYVDICAQYNTYMYVSTLSKAPMYTQPCKPDSEDAKSTYIRTAQKAERLLVTGLYENTLGEFYYQVKDGRAVCYVEASKAEPVRFNTEDVAITDAVYPQVLELGKDFTIAGKIHPVNSKATAVHMIVSGQDGEVIMTHSLAKQSGVYDLQKDTFNLIVDFGILETGVYTFTLIADVINDYYEEDEVLTDLQTVTLCNRTFTVGEDVEMPKVKSVTPRSVRSGWLLRDEVWYYYENGQPRSGWINHNGVAHYLHPDGAVTTGWAEINGKKRFFSGSGAMCTGWLHTDEGSWYLLSNGEPVTGWHTIDEKLYYFDEDGVMADSGWLTLGEKEFYFQEDGSAAIGWVTIKRVNYYFGEDGQLLGKTNVRGSIVTYEVLVEGAELPEYPAESE